MKKTKSFWIRGIARSMFLARVFSPGFQNDFGRTSVKDVEDGRIDGPSSTGKLAPSSTTIHCMGPQLKRETNFLQRAKAKGRSPVAVIKVTGEFMVFQTLRCSCICCV